MRLGFATNLPFFTLCLFLQLIVLPKLSLAETLYQGETTLWQDTVWSGDVVVDGILTVAPEVSLEIRPGTTVSFTFFDSNDDGIGEHELFIQGNLVAEGTAERPIIFTSLNRTAPGSWGAINMMVSNDGNILSHCVVEHAYRGFHAHFSTAIIINSIFTQNMRGLQFQESTVTIDQSEIVNNFNGIQFRDSIVSITQSKISNNMWGVRCLLSEVTIDQSIIENNRVNGLNLRDSDFALKANIVSGNRRGVYLQRSQGKVSKNHVFNNSEHGIFLEDSIVEIAQNSISNNVRSGIKIVHSDVAIFENDFSHYGAALFVLENEEDVDASDNCYESVNELGHYIVDGADRTGYGRLVLGMSMMPCEKFKK